jgi:diacylglycerol kinase (ATP)
MRWTVVVNPAAGRGRTRKLLPELQRACRARDLAVHVASDAADLIRAARDAFERGDGVVAVGGDGTVAALAGVAAEQEGPLAVVPTGAGNDFARHLGLDRRRPLDALALLETGEIRPVDLGRAEAEGGVSRWFTTVANTGFDAEANRWANDITWATGTPLYLLAVLRTLATYRPQPTTVRVDDQEWHGEAWLVAVGNTRTYAGGMAITPDAELDDGLLDVCVIGTASVATFLTKFPSVFRGTHTRVDEVTMLRGRAVELRGGDGPVPLELWASGERVGALPGRVTVVPGALRLVAPSSTARVTSP